MNAAVTTPVAYVENPGPIRLTLPDGETHEAEPFLVQAWQENGRLVGVRLLFPAESLEAAVARAGVTLDEWKLASPEHTASLEKWRAERNSMGYKPNTQSDHLHVSFNSAKDLRFPRQVEIRPSFDMDRPWYVAVGVGFRGERERQRKAATRPVTRPSGDS